MTTAPTDDKKNHDRLGILLLGEGDFSFALDLARFLLAANHNQHNQQQLLSSRMNIADGDAKGDDKDKAPVTDNTLRSIHKSSHIHLMATGVDSAAAVRAKYKDSAFLLGQLIKCHDDVDGADRRSVDATDVNNADETGVNRNNNNGQSTNNGNLSRKGRLTVQVCHEVNAIVEERLINSCSAAPSQRIPPAHMVLFQHPHLGVENAALHGQFLHHLLDSVHKRWLIQQETQGDETDEPTTIHMEPTFILTLVVGQWERWKGAAAAERVGFTLVHRGPFAPPRVDANNGSFEEQGGGNNTIRSKPKQNKATTTISSYYQQRRHQTGKSFRGRVLQSETFTLVRRRGKETEQQHGVKNDNTNENAISDNTVAAAAAATTTTFVNDDRYQPFWMTHQSMSQPQAHGNKTQQDESSNFACPHCDKSFREERSLKSHVRAKHIHEDRTNTNTADKVKDNNTTTKKPRLEQEDYTQKSSFPCTHCAREFSSHAGLQDHVRAKHTGLHLTIQPDWLATTTKLATTTTTTTTGTDVKKNPSSNVNDNNANAVDLDPLSETNSYYVCPICQSRDHKSRGEHWQQFVPAPTSEPNEINTFSCTFCHKPFREQRAQRQHENCCRARTTTTTT